MSTAPPSRRPLATRAHRWPRALAVRLAAFGLSPNAVSLLSIVFAAIAAAAFLASVAATPGGRAAWLLLAAVGIQLRLLCNLLDGLMAVEGGLATPGGELLNELPDRAADILILVAAGYAADPQWAATLGWAAALAAVATAYVRVLGGALGLGQDFRGPMAKQHRMAVLTLGCLIGIGEALAGLAQCALMVALVVVTVGSVATIFRRTRRIASGLYAR
jgi:phosphatidylglycerophosphate synthase